jgi:hypothetical protein
MVEITLLKLTRPETAGDPASLAARVDQLEQRVRRLGSSPPAVARPVAAAATPAVREPSPVVPDGSPGAADEEPSLASPPAEAAEPANQPAAPDDGIAAVEPLPAKAGEPLGELTLGQFESVWPALVAGVRDDLGPRRQALFREASPGSVQGSTVTLYLPDHLSFHLAQLQDDEMVREVIEARAAELLGGSIRIQFRSGSGGAASPADPDEADVVPEKNQLLDAPSGLTDPDALVEGLLGGQVIEEIVKDD